MARHLFSGDFLLRQYRDAKTELINQQAIYERIDDVFKAKLLELTSEAQKIYAKIEKANDDLVKAVADCKIVENNIQTILKNNNADINTNIVTLINQTIDTKLAHYKPTVTNVTNNDSSLDEFEREYQEFIAKQKEKLELKREILEIIKAELPAIINQGS